MQKILPPLLALALLAMACPPMALANRIGNFEIIVRPATKENSETLARGDGWNEKSKEQILAYNVRVELKGVEKMEKLKAKYVVSYRPSGRKLKFAAGEKEIGTLEPFGKCEFNTKGAENSYTEYNSGWGREQYGRAKLEGIALKILQDDKVVAEFANPADAKNLWEKAEEAEKDREHVRD